MIRISDRATDHIVTRIMLAEQYINDLIEHGQYADWSRIFTLYEQLKLLREILKEAEG